MHGEFAGKIKPPAACLNGIDVADEVGHGNVRSRELFNIALLRSEIGNWSRVTFFRYKILARTAKWLIGIVVDLTSLYIGQVGIEQRCERA